MKRSNSGPAFRINFCLNGKPDFYLYDAADYADHDALLAEFITENPTAILWDLFHFEHERAAPTLVESFSPGVTK